MSGSRTGRMHPERHLEHLRTESAAFLEIIGCADLAAKVPSCPDWSLHDLADHLGWVYRWADQKVAGAKRSDIDDAPTQRDGLCRWFAESTDIVRARLGHVSPDLPCWTFNEAGHASFWMRRMALETALHRWDAQLCQGEPGAIDAELATDGVDEVVSMYIPRQIRLARMDPLRHTLAIEVVGDTTPSESFVLTAEGGAADSPADATVSGSPETMLLLLWNRITVDDPRVALTGSSAAARDVLAADLAP